MQTTIQPTMTTCHAMEAGEIARAHMGGGSTLFIKFEATDRGSLIGLLASPDQYHTMAFLELRNDINCLSFGKDWVLDPLVDADVFPENPKRYDMESPLVLDSNGYWLTFRGAPGSGFMGPQGFRLSDCGKGNPSNEAAPISNWSIWASLDDRKLGLPDRQLFRFGDDRRQR